MPFKPLISPHVHQSSLDTGSTQADFLKRVKELNVGALVCTDHGFMGACRGVYDSAQKNKLIPIVGIEAYHRDSNCAILKADGIERVQDFYKYGHLLIHAKDQPAYEALIKKLSDRDLTAEFHGSERKPIFDWQDLEELGGYNVTMSSGCLAGIVSRFLIANRPDLAIKYYEKVRSLVRPGDFMVEIFPHKCDKNWVSAGFIECDNGTVLKYYLGKKVQTEKFEKISVSELADEIKHGHDAGKLIGVYNNRTLDPLPPAKIKSCKIVQDFVQNECTDFAPDGDIQLACNRWMLETANKYGDLAYVSDDAHYSSKDQKVIQEVKLANMGDSFRFYGSHHVHTSDEAFEYFKSEMGMSESQFESIIENSHNWASKFKDFKLNQPASLPKSFYPEDTTKYLAELIDKHGRMPNDQVYKDRLEQEIKLFRDNGTLDLLPYFFLSEDICSEYGRRGLIHGACRGSSGGVLVSYLLGITSIDPIPHGLSLDRFITLDRIQTGNLPDIDTDFPDRDILIDPKEGYLFKRFGPNCSKISTVTMLRIKNSMRDVARFSFGYVPQDIEAWAKSVKAAPQGVEDLNYLFGYTTQEGKEVTGYFYESDDLQAYARKYPEQWDTVQKALRVQRGNGVHASAIVICDKPVDHIVPIMTTGDDRVTQCPPAGVEASGGIKIDILGLNSLKDIQSCMDILKEGMEVPKELSLDGVRVPDYQLVPYNGRFVDIWNLPHSKEVYEDICAGNTDSVFQLGTNSAKKGLKAFSGTKPDGSPMINSIADGAAFIALDRPGPLDAEVEGETGAKRNMLEEYAARISGRKKYGEIPFLTEHLPETQGILIFQEGLTKVYRILSGCSGMEAEMFRKDIGKKNIEKVNARFPSFMENAVKKVDKETAEKIWQQIQVFGNYGFCQAHSVGYFYITYATAFLKYHFPIQWWCAVLRNAKKEEIVEKFWPHCHHMVIPPQINSSENEFNLRDGKIVAPLSLVKGLGPKAHEELVAGMPYSDIEDFCNKIARRKRETATMGENGKIRAGRSALDSGVVNSLIISGVMDSLFPQGMSLIGKMELYQAKLATALGKKKPDKVKEVYASYNPLQIYQHKKKLLDIYSEDLVPILYSSRVDGVSLGGTKVRYYSYFPEDAKTIGSIMEQAGLSKRLKTLPFINGQQFKELNEEASINEGETLRVAVAGFVESDTIFSFNKKDKLGNKTSKVLRARKYTLNIDGVTETLVKWPDWDKEKLTSLQTNTTGSIIIAVLSKNRETRPFKVDAIIEVQQALEKEN
jgi:DNA polymerase III alpha subunit